MNAKAIKKKQPIKLKIKLKLENDIKIEPIAIKQPRALFSQTLPPKRLNTCTKQQTKVMKKLNNCLEDWNDGISAIKDVLKDAIDSKIEDSTEI